MKNDILVDCLHASTIINHHQCICLFFSRFSDFQIHYHTTITHQKKKIDTRLKNMIFTRFHFHFISTVKIIDNNREKFIDLTPFFHAFILIARIKCETLLYVH